MAGQLPTGFKVDKQKVLPQGFVVDSSPSIRRGPSGSVTTEPNIEARDQLVSNIRQNQPEAVQGLEAREERAQAATPTQRGSLPIVGQIARRYVEGVNPATLPDAALPRRLLEVS